MSTQSAITGDYCDRYGVRQICLTPVTGVVEGADPVCNVDIDFDDGYHVQFKLPATQALAAQSVSRMSSDGSIDYSDAAGGADEDTLKAFFVRIESRLAKIKHEESVQGITFLGNTFVLNNKTVFDVVEDDDGRLTIEMHRGEERRPAMLMASALLDGLYDGSILLQQ